MRRVTTSTTIALLVKQRNDAIQATYDWSAVCAERDQIIKNQQQRIEELEAGLERSLSFPKLHPMIQYRCQKLYENGHLDDAVAAAMKSVEVELRSKASSAEPSLTAVQLASQVMTGPQPQIQFSSQSNLQDTVHLLFRGAFGTFRNPVAHTFPDTDDAAVAFEKIALASQLLRMLDDATKNPLGIPSSSAQVDTFTHTNTWRTRS